MALDLYRELAAKHPHRDDIRTILNVAEERLRIEDEKTGNDDGKAQ